MNFDFERDILIWTCSHIEKLGYEPKHENSAANALSQLFNIIRNLIPAKARNIRISKYFSCPEKYLNGYNQILSEIREGKNLAPRCSRQQKKKHGYIDGALIDWNIYHLHLGDKLIISGKNKNLIQGHKDILFTFIDDENAYIIGIFDHDSWTKQSVLQIVYDNWPWLLEPFKINRAIDLAIDVTDDDRKQLRNAFVNSPIKLGDHVYFGPGGGITAAGTGYNEVHKANIILDAVQEMEFWITNHSDYLNKLFENKSVPLNQEILKFDVSRFVFKRNYSITATKNSLRLYIPSD